MRLLSNNENAFISDDNLTVSFIPSSNPGSAFGTIDIKENDDCIYIWTIKILDEWSMDRNIGLIDASIKLSPGESFDYLGYGDDKYYACNGAYKESHNIDLTYKHSEYEESVYDEQYGEFDEGEIIKMELNTKDKTLRYFQDDIDKGIAFDNIDFSNDTVYNLALSVTFHRNAPYEFSFYKDKFDLKSFQLIDFQQKPLNI